MSNSSPVQLSLHVSLNDEATFENFYASGETNAQARQALEMFALGQGENCLMIWGARGCGLTHLLQSVCHDASENNITIQYIPMRHMIGYSAEDICEGLDGVEIVCVDGIEYICGNREWELALFHLFNRIKDAGHKILISSHTSPPSLPILLADLKSRLLGCVIYHIESLNDTGKEEALVLRAAARGMEMSAEVARFILSRASRDTNELFNLLHRLDDASLQHQRKLTIPFVKEILNL